MTIPKEPVAQPDPHEGARKWLAECEWVELIDSRGVDELAALLREREAAAERRGENARDEEVTELLISALAECHRNAKAMRQYDETEARARELATLYVEEMLLTIRSETFARALPLPGDSPATISRFLRGKHGSGDVLDKIDLSRRKR